MLRQIDESLWCHDAPVTLRPGGMRMPARTTVVRLADGLWVHSPLAIDDELAASIAALGEVRHLVAPNLFHHLYLGGAIERFPAARVYAPARLRSKRPELRVDVALEDAGEPWPELATLAIAGVPELDECVFFHQPSATLIVSDLVFNLHEVDGPMLPMILRMVGAWKRLAQSKLWRRYTKDRAAAAASVAAVLAQPMRRLIPAHGEIVEGPELPG